MGDASSGGAWCRVAQGDGGDTDWLIPMLVIYPRWAPRGNAELFSATLLRYDRCPQRVFASFVQDLIKARISLVGGSGWEEHKHWFSLARQSTAYRQPLGSGVSLVLVLVSLTQLRIGVERSTFTTLGKSLTFHRTKKEQLGNIDNKTTREHRGLVNGYQGVAACHHLSRGYKDLRCGDIVGGNGKSSAR
ncbi:hypothetical protein CBL_01416 [Carabus blaptoides fortunei]